MTDACPAVIAATGLYTPPNAISNEELVSAYNAWAEQWNQANASAIAAGELTARELSSAEFIEKASGIKSRYVLDKTGVLDVDRMAPALPKRSDDELSIMAEIAVHAAREALERAGRAPEDIDAVIVAASNMQRSYPAVAIEVQQALGIDGFAFDMNVACSTATFGFQAAADMIAAGTARAILVINPEICSAHLNWRDRDSHFIFGDVATATVLERGDAPRNGRGAWEILGVKLRTQFSSNIRNNAGYLNRCEAGVAGDPGPASIHEADTDKLFVQQGRKVFRDVVPWVSTLISEHLGELGVEPSALKRMWLHQANRHMNDLIAKSVLGHVPSEEESPVILDTYANTSSAGCVIAFHQYTQDFEPGDLGLICSFGAGYSAGSVVVRRVA